MREISVECKCGCRSHQHARLMIGEFGCCNACRKCDGFEERRGLLSDIGLPMNAIIVDDGQERP